MLISIHIDREKRKNTMELEENTTIGHLLSLLKINPVTVIVAKNREIVTEEEILSGNDEISIISVVSGG